ncbi:DUF3010 family protein [Oceanospirillum maris]|uniref:DUF3010 family protein n=1 Tax=Oceanospirillum maris TaxID=64977 RepID=UPI0004246545|nr:DUF3010 family protein [Oceanospirillum maris]
MKVCGVELKGSEALICLLSKSGDLFDIPDCRQIRFTIKDSDDQQQMRYFQQSFAKLLEDYKIDRVVIRQRPHKGKFAGGAVGFKMEGALQALTQINVSILTPSQIKEQLKKTPMPVNFGETGLKQFQEPAFTTAFAYLSNPLNTPRVASESTEADVDFSDIDTDIEEADAMPAKTDVEPKSSPKADTVKESTEAPKAPNPWGR